MKLDTQSKSMVEALASMICQANTDQFLTLTLTNYGRKRGEIGIYASSALFGDDCEVITSEKYDRYVRTGEEIGECLIWMADQIIKDQHMREDNDDERRETETA